MKKERADIRLDAILPNTGQLEWLPRNPRTWTPEDVENTANSIKEDEDFLEDRPLLVVPFKGGKVITFAGNLRFEGCKHAGKVSAPCVTYYPKTEEDYATILRRAMKDNGQFGKTDWHEVFSSKWGTLPLEKWGLTQPGWDMGEGDQSGDRQEPGDPAAGSPDDYGTDFSLQDGERAPFQQMAFTLADEQVAEVKEAIKQAKELEEFKTNINYGNENGNGNALSLIIEQWLQQRK